jgi:hypothetical protein
MQGTHNPLQTFTKGRMSYLAAAMWIQHIELAPWRKLSDPAER